MPTVVINASSPIFPQICVCCGGPPDRTLTDSGLRSTGNKVIVSTDDNKSVSFPVCANCILHHRRDTSTFGFLSPAAVRSMNCEAVSCLADFVSWSGNERRFRFDSPRYTQAFVAANQAARKNIVSVDMIGAPRYQLPQQDGGDAQGQPVRGPRSKFWRNLGLAVLGFVVLILALAMTRLGDPQPAAGARDGGIATGLTAPGVQPAPIIQSPNVAAPPPAGTATAAPALPLAPPHEGHQQHHRSH